MKISIIDLPLQFEGPFDDFSTVHHVHENLPCDGTRHVQEVKYLSTYFFKDLSDCGSFIHRLIIRFVTLY